ncbi:pilus assembly protein PilM [Candidatus Uhrbacteria bacterium]|nr:pilus assembly protein PilM [Candidatus Uhrbacteria bacterium]
MKQTKKTKKSKNIIGIDIADHTLSLVELEKNRNHPHITSVTRVSIPSGIVVRGRIRDAEKLQELFEYAISAAHPAPMVSRNAIMGIPDSQLYTHLARLPAKKDSEFEEVARSEAFNTFPIEKRDLVYSYRSVSHTTDGADTVFIATSKEVLREWDLFFRRIGISVLFYDSEVLATARGLVAHGGDNAFCLVDIGAATTTVSVFDVIGIRYVYSIEHAGSALTEGIAKLESLPFDEAQKRKHELDLADIPTSLAAILPSFFDPILKEIDTAIKYVSQSYNVSVAKIILVGGTAALKGLPEYISKHTGIDTERGVSIITNAEQSRVQREEPSIESIGLALYGLNQKEYENSPNLISPPEDTAQGEVVAKKGAPQAYDASVEKMKEFRDIRKEQKRMRNQIMTLVVVLVVGTALLMAAFWYQRQEQERKEQALRKAIPQYTYQQTAQMLIPISIQGSAEGMASGSLSRISVPEDTVVNDAIRADAEVNLRRQLQAGQDYWNKPFDPPLSFLVFNKNEVRLLANAMIAQRAGTAIPYDVGYIEYLDAEKSEDTPVFFLTVRASISAQAPLQGLE